MQTIIKEWHNTGRKEVVGVRPARSHKQVHRIREELIRLNQNAEPGTIYYAE